MKNLALGSEASEDLVRALNETIRAELIAAGLEPLSVQRAEGEVPYEWVAELDTPCRALRFERSWRYWWVRGKVPMALAEKLYPNKLGIRAAGHGCNVAPSTEAEHFAPDGREYVTVVDLRGFACSDTFRRLWDRNARDRIVVFEMPPDSAYVTSYHIDTQEGLNTFVAQAKAYYAT